MEMGSRMFDRFLRRRGANADPASASSSSDSTSRFDRSRIIPQWDERSARAPLLEDAWDNASTIAPSRYSVSTAVDDNASVITKKKSSDSLATIRKATGPEASVSPAAFGKTKPKDGKKKAKSSYKYPRGWPEFPYLKKWARSPVLPVDASSEIDPLVAAIRYNSTNSPLLRLPDKVLINIMRYLDGSAMYSVRHTSRTFLRLFSSDEFTTLQAKSKNLIRPWAHQFTSQLDQRVLEYYRRDAYCPACAHVRREKRKDPRYEALFHQSLWCAGCGEDHPAAAFAIWQRREPDDSRICIGHEGHFRICAHRTISWLDVQEWLAAVAHLDAYGVNSVGGNLCTHPDHMYMCEPSLLEHGEVKFNLDTGGHSETLSIRLSSDHHVSIPQDPVSSVDIRRAFSAAQEAGGRHLGPPLRPGASTHMAAFDPGNCGCLTYPGSESVEMPIGGATSNSCRAKKKLKGEEGGTTRPGYHFYSFRGVSGACNVGYYVRAETCPTPCRKMEIRYVTTISLRSVDKDNVRKVDPVWFRALSPESYELAEDWESRHVLWCPDARCLNYHANAGIDRFWGWRKS